MSTKTQLSIGILLLLSLFSPLIYNIVSLANNCENVADFSIYQQAIYDSFALKNPNPFLTIRNVHILQDHFDPVFLLAGPWAALFNYSPYSLLVFEWLFLVATLGVLIYFSKDTRSILLWSFLLLWNRGIIHAIGYPLHPTTWSMLPITLMLIAIKEKRERLFWISCLSLFFFKEIFPIATLGLSLGFISTKHYKKGSMLLAISLLFCLFNFYGRTHLLAGESLNYAANFWQPWLNNFWGHLSNFPLEAAFKYLLPATIPLYLIVNKKYFKREDFLLLSFWIPLFLIQLIALRFDYHNSSMLSWPLILLLWKREYLLHKNCHLLPFSELHNARVTATNWGEMCVQQRRTTEAYTNVRRREREGSWSRRLPQGVAVTLHKKMLTLLIVIYAYTGFTAHKKNYFHLFNEKIGEHCEISPNKRESIKKIRSLVFQTPIDSTLLGTGGNIPLILRPNAKVYHIRGYSPLLKQYDYILLGRKENFYPINKNDLERIWNNCLKRPPSDIIFKDDYHLMVKGPVSAECL